MSNSFAVNTTPVNTYSSNTGITGYALSSISINDVVIPVHFLPVSSRILLTNSTSNTHDKNHIVLDVLAVTDALSSKALFKELLSDTVSALSKISVVFNATASTSILFSSSSLIQFNTSIEALERMFVTDLAASKARFSSLLIDSLVLASSLTKVLWANVNELITVNNTLNILYKLSNTIISDILASSTSSTKIVTLVSLSSNINVSSTSFTKGILNTLISDGIIVSIGTKGDDTYLAYLYSPETASVSTYDSYKFDGCAKFNHKYLFYNKNGLYEFGGDTDDGTAITAAIETVAFNFNSSNLKQVPAIYLGVASSDTFILKVRVDGKAEVLYKLNKRTHNLNTQKIDIGKGLIGRYFQFELITQASEFNLESIEFYPLELKRKL